MLKEYCRVCDVNEKGFTGLRFVDGVPEIVFPIGYKKSDTDKEIRRDTLNLLTVLNKFSNKNMGSKAKTDGGEEHLSLPLAAYQYVIFDFLSNGYYSEKDTEYKINRKGKINWKRTIQKIRPIVDNGNPIYLDFVVKKSVSKADMIARIHEYCVFESFSKIGWLYLEHDFVPQKPTIQYNKTVFLTYIQDALKHTFNTEKKKLLSSMIDIVNTSTERGEFPEMYYGIDDFKYIWERLIDYAYGVENKQDYFPHGHYRIVSVGKEVESSPLKPDTIIDRDGKVYILDAKFYGYGVDSKKSLPPTDSIHKQITYGDYVATNNFVDDKNKVYNAFILPYESDGSLKPKFIAVGTGDWIKYDEKTPNYKYIAVLCLDIKHIINTYAHSNPNDVAEMAACIEESISRYRKDLSSAQ